MRIGRVDSESGTEYTYYYNGSLLRVMTVDGNKLYFVYDAAGRPIEVSYTPAGSTTVGFYYFVTNLQGDVIAILNSSGTVVVEYTYDAWGKILSITGSMASTLGVQNPLRYRGYVYDQETNLYYLQSRYYDPEIGRFINADALVSTGQDLIGNNMFAYCGNNPVMRRDASGDFWEAIAIGFVAGVIGQYVSDVIQNIQSGQTGIEAFLPTSSGIDYLASGLGGAITATPGLNLLGTMAVGAIGNIVSDGIKGNISSWEDVVNSAKTGAIANGIGYGFAKTMAAIHTKYIENMPRAQRKVYLRDEFYCNSQVNANINLKTFANSSFSTNMGIVERQNAIFRSGVYSTITSTLATLF